MVLLNQFVAKLRSNPPTREMKLQLLQEIAQETNIEWDSKGLEQKLYTSHKQVSFTVYYCSFLQI